MRNWRKPAVLAGLILLAAAGLHAAKKEKVKAEVAVIDTNLGKFVFRFFSEESPKTVEAFKKLVRSRFFDGTLIHRVLPGLLIQGGDPTTREEGAEQPDVEVESLGIEKNDLKHRTGTVSMAHERNDLHSRSQFFVSLQEVTYFDGKYTVVGEIISGLKVVEAISNVPRNLKQMPLYPVRVKRVTLEIQEFMKEVK